MRRIQHNNVNLRIYKGGNPIQNVICDADSCAAQQPAVFIPGRIRVLHRFFDILDRNQALQHPFFIHNRELFNAVAAKNILRLGQCSANRCRNEVFPGHNVGNRLVKIGTFHKPQITVCDDPD